MSTTTSVVAEDIIHEFGDPHDFSTQTCECFRNTNAFCFDD